MNLIDAHCHLANLAETHNVKLLINEAKSKGIDMFISGALTKKEVSWHQQNPDPAILWHAGIHPNFPDCDLDLELIRALCMQKQMVVIGEIGMDRNNKDLESQSKILHQQLELAVEYNKTVVLHIVGRQSESYAILKQYPLRYLVHGYAGSMEGFELLARLDSYFTISSRILKADKTKLLDGMLQTHRIMFETDMTQYYVKKGESNPLLQLLDVFEQTISLGDYIATQLLEMQDNSFQALFGDKL